MQRRRVIASAIGIAVVGTAALRGSLRRFEVKESSMSPALESGDWVVGRRMTQPPARGDIVVFKDPAGTGINLVKRVIGLGGETIEVESGRVLVDDALLADRWANGATTTQGSWVVPSSQIWVLGDNRRESRSDGRTIGPIPIEDVAWLVVARYWPLARAQSLR
jgi:signal peptidase I